MVHWTADLQPTEQEEKKNDSYMLLQTGNVLPDLFYQIIKLNWKPTDLKPGWKLTSANT